MEIKLGTASVCMVSHEGRFNALSFYNWNNDRKALFYAAENSGEAMWKFPSRVLKVFVLCGLSQVFLSHDGMSGPVLGGHP